MKDNPRVKKGVTEKYDKRGKRESKGEGREGTEIGSEGRAVRRCGR